MGQTDSEVSSNVSQAKADITFHTPTCPSCRSIGERGSSSAPPSSSSQRPEGPLRRELEGAPSFIADIFFLTQKAVWVGLLPALYRYHSGWRFTIGDECGKEFSVKICILIKLCRALSSLGIRSCEHMGHESDPSLPIDPSWNVMWTQPL